MNKSLAKQVVIPFMVHYEQISESFHQLNFGIQKKYGKAGNKLLVKRNEIATLIK
ncbi:hypothetical protein MYP_1503 [Sporocytophaga myxococcoides]|uniref:Uncharacterized protein n=1 Tax=Sporocytophaga myxococcoides TaxID=153721 RepID=A0A098LBK1_9BACT|nr:hypothetical protein MYP_1503 [Sporocytophaga myxococcoides]